MLLPSSRPQLLREVYSSGTLVFDRPARTWEAKLNFQFKSYFDLEPQTLADTIEQEF